MQEQVEIRGDPSIFEGAPFIGKYTRTSQTTWSLELSGKFSIYYFKPKQQWIVGTDESSGEGWMYAPANDTVLPTDVTLGDWFFHDPDDRKWKKGGGLHIVKLSVKRPRSVAAGSSDDYMSDAFLQAPASAMSSASQRENKGDGWTWSATKANKKAKNGAETGILSAPEQMRGEKLRDMMRRQLSDGLHTSIPKSNKGHRLLAKMGYKEGMGLGKDGHGRKAPVKVHLEQKRVGLGRHAEVEEMRSKRRRMQNVAASRKKNAFLHTARSRALMRKLEKDLGALRRICEDFDRKNNVESNSLWGTSEELYSSTGYESDDDKEAAPTLQDLEAPNLMKSGQPPPDSRKNPLLRSLGEDLRGNSSNGRLAKGSGRGMGVREEIDINDNPARGLFQKAYTHERIYERTMVRASVIGSYVPPGHRGQRLKLVLEARSRMDIQEARSLIEDIAGGTGSASRPLDESRQLVTELIEYLRSKYHYCYYCSITFNDKGDMDANCPGQTEEDHAD